MKAKLHFYILFAIAALLLTSCGGSKQVVEEQPEPQRPSWLMERPISSLYYIGIGGVKKSEGNTDYIQQAKNSALADLSSEIEVRIESNSLYYQLERDYKFEDQFRSTIQSEIRSHLSGYQIVNSWETDDEYWVYYRLSKQQYQEDRANEKQQALRLAKEQYLSAQEQEESGNAANAIRQYFQILFQLEDYWGEVNEVTINGENRLIDQLTLNACRKLLDQISIQTDPEVVALNYDNQFQSRLSIQLQSAIPSGSMQLQIKQAGQFSEISKTVSTQEDGQLLLPIDKPADLRKESAIKVNFSIEQFFPTGKQEELSWFSNAFPAKEVLVPVDVQLPKLFIEGKETNLGEPLSGISIKEQLAEALSRRQLSITSQKSKADLIIRLNAESKDGGKSGNFWIAYLNYDLELIPSGKSESRTINGKTIKGVQSSLDRAGMNAYEKLARETNSLAKRISDIILQ